MIGVAERSDPDDEVKSAAVSIARVMKGGALEWMQEPLIELASWNRTMVIGVAERSDPDDEVKSAAVSIARVMKGGALEWMQEPLIELASWNRTITKQLEAEARAAKKK